MRKSLFTLLLILAIKPLIANGQNQDIISSIVIDDKDSTALSYVNVMLYSRDSVFLTGTITNEEGTFSIENNHRQGNYLRLSTIGYTTRYIPLEKINKQIIMNENTKVLSEVIVKGNRNFVKPTDQGLSVSMKDNPISSLGTALDALSQMPLIDGSTGTLKIIGKGSPEIYINHKLVRDTSELSRLSANDIENIEIITNPGAKYGAEVSSVIIIRTKKKDSGLGGEIMLSGTKTEVWSSQLEANLNYKNQNGLNLFGGIDLSNNGFKQKRTYNEIFNKNNSYTTTTGIHKNRNKKIHASIGSNYDFKENSAGIKYEFTRTPYHIYQANNDITTNVNATNGELISSNKENNQNYRHYANAYILLKVWEKGILSADADYISGNNKHHTLSEESTLQTSNSILTYNNNTYKLSAFKVNLNTPLWKGELDLGGQYSYTENEQDFSTASTNKEQAQLFKPATDKSDQHFGATYLSYQYPINGSLSCYAGIRYEITDFTYHQNGTLVEGQSKKYNDILPNAGISYNNKETVINLYYKPNILRPSYQLLNNNYSYVSHTLWETGNPLLRSSLQHNLGASISWKKLILSATYGRNKRSIYSVYENLPDKGINIRREINLPDYNSYTFTFYTHFDWSFWHPMLQALLQIQDLTYGTPSTSYKKPIYQVYMSNRFDLPSKFYAYLSGVWLSKGNDRTAYSEGGGMVNVRINKTLGNWSFNAQANDILNTWRQKNKFQTNGILYNYHIKGASRSITLSINYKFNSKKKTYKGTGAGKNEIERL